MARITKDMIISELLLFIILFIIIRKIVINVLSKKLLNEIQKDLDSV